MPPEKCHQCRLHVAGKTSLLWKVTETAKNPSVQILDVPNMSHLWFNTLSCGKYLSSSESGEVRLRVSSHMGLPHVGFIVARRYVG